VKRFCESHVACMLDSKISLLVCDWVEGLLFALFMSGLWPASVQVIHQYGFTRYRWLGELHQRLLEMFSKSPLDSKEVGCLKMTQNNVERCGNRSLGVTHVHFKPQIRFTDLIPLLSTYFFLGFYIYFSVRKYNFIMKVFTHIPKLRWFSTAVSLIDGCVL